MSKPPPIPAYAPGTFARFTIERRLPKILADARATLDAGPAGDARFRALEAAILAGSAIELDLFSAPTPFWEETLEGLSGARWSDLSFFDLELLFYRAIDSIANALRPGFDVFAPVRRAALADALPRVTRAVSSMDASLTLGAVVGAALAGNEADLSQLSRPYAATDDAVLKDERPALAAALPRRSEDAVVVLADNAGSELCFDLLLVDLLLREHARVVELQVKPRPMFVSDALLVDVDETLAAFASAGEDGPLRAVAARLALARAQGRLLFTAPADWAEPRHMNGLDPSLASRLRQAAVVIAKGDLNSRRFFEDRAWPADSPVREASVATDMCAFALRVLKSDCVVGLPSPLVSRLFATEPEWRSSGKYSVIQRVDRGAAELDASRSGATQTAPTNQN